MHRRGGAFAGFKNFRKNTETPPVLWTAKVVILDLAIT